MFDDRALPCLVAAVGAALLGACAASNDAAAGAVVVRYYVPSEIIVPDGNAGKFHAANGCIFFDYGRERRWRVSALFPPGTRLSANSRSIVLPNGQSIPFGKEVAIVYERPPFGARDETCGPRPIEVLHLRER